MLFMVRKKSRKMIKKIGIASDHAGYLSKKKLCEYMLSKDFHVKDLGCDSEESVDYPEYGVKLGKAVANKDVDLGVAICGSGIGISIAANKVKGVRAALCTSDFHAEMSKRHNDANIIAFGAKVSSINEMISMFDIWISSKFEFGRHEKRIQLIG